jgi:hypothetical protein
VDSRFFARSVSIVVLQGLNGRSSIYCRGRAYPVYYIYAGYVAHRAFHIIGKEGYPPGLKPSEHEANFPSTNPKI